MLSIVLEQFASLAWSKLGLQPDPVTNRIAKDLDQARLAIDVVADLVKHLEPRLDEDDRRQLQSMLRDLRVNFVQQGQGS